MRTKRARQRDESRDLSRLEDGEEEGLESGFPFCSYGTAAGFPVIKNLFNPTRHLGSTRGALAPEAAAPLTLQLLGLTHLPPCREYGLATSHIIDSRRLPTHQILSIHLGAI